MFLENGICLHEQMELIALKIGSLDFSVKSRFLMCWFLEKKDVV